MNCFRKILVAVEPGHAVAVAGDRPSGPSEHALTRAIWLANGTGAELTIFSVVSLPLFMEQLLAEQLSDTQQEDAPTQATREMLERCAAQAKAVGVDARIRLARGIPWQEICRHVKSESYDVVIAGTRDLGRLGRILFGSTGMELLHNCPAPVWLARPGARADRCDILVPSDFSESSSEALRLALEIGRYGRACVHLLHVIDEPLAPPAWYVRVPHEMIEEYLAGRRAEAKKRLHQQLAACGDRTPELGVRVHVVEGSADEEILRAIDDLNASLVVMGTAARSGVSRVVLGNTAERLVSHMRCSLVAVKPPGFECPLSLETEAGSRPADSLRGPSMSAAPAK